MLFIWIVAEIGKWWRRGLLNSQSGLQDVLALSWQEFEALVGEAFRRRDYVVEELGGSTPDGGVDLIIHRGGQTTFVQCKHWKSRRIGVKTVREVLGVVAAKQAAGGIVVTCGSFTNEARAFAESNPIDLIDGPRLWDLVQAVRKEGKLGGPAYRAGEARPASESNAVPAGARAAGRSPGELNGAATVETARADQPVCPACGAPMTRRVARRGAHKGQAFLGCSRYPDCRGKRQLPDSETAAST